MVLSGRKMHNCVLICLDLIQKPRDKDVHKCFDIEYRACFVCKYIEWYSSTLQKI